MDLVGQASQSGKEETLDNHARMRGNGEFALFTA